MLLSLRTFINFMSFFLCVATFRSVKCLLLIGGALIKGNGFGCYMDVSCLTIAW